MVTFFSVPKAFEDHIAVIQENAIRSWCSLRGVGGVILMGNEPGVAEFANRLRIDHVSDIKKNSHGTPLLNDAFEKAAYYCTSEVLVYANTDMILGEELVDAVESIEFERYLMSGQRWNVQLKSRLSFPGTNLAALLQNVRKQTKPYSPWAMDYFAYPRASFGRLPPFSIGRAGWDNWMIYNARRHRIPVIDATASVTAIHQTHTYEHAPDGFRSTRQGEEAQENRRIAGDGAGFFLHHGTHTLTSDGPKRVRAPTRWRHLLGVLSIIHPEYKRWLLPLRWLATPERLLKHVSFLDRIVTALRLPRELKALERAPELLPAAYSTEASANSELGK